MKLSSPLGSSAGFTYIAALVIVVILGIMSARAAQVWKTTMQREKETELIFRGSQIKDAMRLYYGMKGNVITPAPGRPNLSRLEDLLQDTGSAGKKRYLRKLYKDPITGKDFALVKNSNQLVVGVASTSEEEPIKKGNFPLDLDPRDLNGKKAYNEWQFRCDRAPKVAAGGGTVGGLETVKPDGSQTKEPPPTR